MHMMLHDHNNLNSINKINVIIRANVVRHPLEVDCMSTFLFI